MTALDHAVIDRQYRGGGKRAYITGFCAGANHDRCPSVISGAVCRCDCHDQLAPPPDAPLDAEPLDGADLTPLPVEVLPPAAVIPPAAEVVGEVSAVPPVPLVLSLRDRASLVAIADVLAGAITEGRSTVRQGVLDDLVSRYQEEGTKSLVVRLPGSDETVATITLNVPKDSVDVADERALLAWVKANRPTEVITTEVVRPSFLKWLLDNAEPGEADESCTVPNTETGELLTVAGLKTRKAGTPSSFALRFESDGRRRMRDAALSPATIGQLVAAAGPRVIDADTATA